MKNTTLLTSLCLALSQADEGAIPDWVELIPAGVQVKGLDGREWINDQPQNVLKHFDDLRQSGRDLVFDFEHATEIKAPNGEQAPASGWGVAMQKRENGSIWAQVDWTASGKNAIAAKEYRYLSPVLIYEKNTRRIVGIQSVALTNKANLLVSALNQQESTTETPMDLTKLIAALGLAATATIDDVLAKIAELKTAVETAEGEVAVANNHAANPPLDKFVPRSDYDTALNQVNAVTRKLADFEKARLDSEIETAINHALATGKITPATKDYHVANCQQAGGLERFKAFVASAPEIGGASNIDGRKPDGTDKALNHEEKTIAAIFGNSVEDIKKYGVI